MSDRPEVSVLIPAYNMSDHVEGAVASVLQEDLSGMEVIVLNDGSTDDTLQSVEPFTDSNHPAYDPRVRLHTHENRGKPATLNRGFRLSEGNYIAIVDADDEVPPAGIMTRYQTAEQENADFVIGACEVFRGNESLDVWETPTTTDPAALRRGFFLFPRQPFHLNACLMSRSLVERTGDVNEERTRCQDIDFAMRLLSHARSLVTTNHVTYRYRKYRTSLRSRLQLRLKTMLHRMMVMVDNLDGWERIAGPLVGLSYDALKMVYEMLAGAYPKRSA